MSSTETLGKLPLLIIKQGFDREVGLVEVGSDAVTVFSAENLFLAIQGVRRLRGRGLPVPLFCLLVVQALRDSSGRHQSKIRETTFWVLFRIMLGEILPYELWDTRVTDSILAAFMREEGMFIDWYYLEYLTLDAIAIANAVAISELEGFITLPYIDKSCRAWRSGDRASPAIHDLGRQLLESNQELTLDWGWAGFKSKVDLILGGSDCTLDFIE